MTMQRSHRSRRVGLTFILCALFVGFTTLFAQQPAPTGDNGPVLASSEIQQGAILLHFTNADGGLVLKSAGRGAFQIAGADRVWFPAEAHLVNNILVVSTSLVQQPTAVRYTWPTAADAVVFNRAGIPAAPFHTDR
ncbi:hypothetical protein [Occallatibacter riparius]|uniref:Uncharacterized protein n=1 Tax=Occallatibacter riparius TaxID=1002689 RepID=A0A9J7BN85_9BACT|nr:hypothetical protein [Occallatibacter riparius]UWZ82374.1 hypothetical protein MOP44_17565 [Occallatibacter riparius]